jgi:hypothetical protein
VEGVVCHLRLADGDIFLNCYSYARIQGEHLDWLDFSVYFNHVYAM